MLYGGVYYLQNLEDKSTVMVVIEIYIDNMNLFHEVWY